jgi:hypothetical protein
MQQTHEEILQIIDTWVRPIRSDSAILLESNANRVGEWIKNNADGYVSHNNLNEAVTSLNREGQIEWSTPPAPVVEPPREKTQKEIKQELNKLQYDDLRAVVRGDYGKTPDGYTRINGMDFPVLPENVTKAVLMKSGPGELKRYNKIYHHSQVNSRLQGIS